MNNKIRFWIEKNAVIVFLLLIVIGFSIATPAFLNLNNIINVTSQMSINALLTVGLTFVIITGGIDIGVGSVAAFAGIFAAFLGLRFQGMSPFTALILQVGCAIFIGGLCGFFNGVLVTKFKVVPMIATLAMMSIARGFAYVVTGGQPVYGLPHSFAWLGSGRLFVSEANPLGVIPVITVFTVVIVIVMHLLLSKTVFGRHVYAVGSNENVAHLSGINVNAVKIKAYIICSIMAALGGVCVASKLNNGQPASSTGYEMFAIASTVLGGTSFAGGIGSISRAMIGVAIIAIINNGMNLMQVSSYWQRIITGLIILFAVIIDMLQKRSKK